MKTILKAGIVLAALGACDNGGNNPLTNPVVPNKDLPPGTNNPSASDPVERYEAKGENGNGYAQSITYDKKTDTFRVDNLAFDANNVYSRDDVVSTLGGFKVYENAATYADSVTGKPINQLSHKAILGVSKNTTADGKPVTQFAVVRTGAYVPYGFGGFMYQRNEGVVLPTTGQATFRGDYAGLRDFSGRGGIEYVTGDMVLDIDFNDFNAGDAVKGRISDRKILNVNGRDITSTYTGALGVNELPVVKIVIGPGTINKAGEINGEMVSHYYNSSTNAVETYEKGKYFAVLAGSGGDMEVAGVVVIESKDPSIDSVTARETGGFILYR